MPLNMASRIGASAPVRILGAGAARPMATNGPSPAAPTTYAYSGPQQQMFFNLENGILQNQKVRVAVAHGLDLKKLLNVALFGYGDVSPSPVSVALPKW